MKPKTVLGGYFLQDFLAISITNFDNQQFRASIPAKSALRAVTLCKS